MRSLPFPDRDYFLGGTEYLEILRKEYFSTPEMTPWDYVANIGKYCVPYRLHTETAPSAKRSGAAGKTP